MTLDPSTVGKTGYGLMGLTWRKEPPPREQALEAMRTAVECGCSLWNGGELYGSVNSNSNHLLREYFTKYPEDAAKTTINIKGGLEKGGIRPIGTPENVRRSVEDSLKALRGTHKIDIFECARVDPDTPIEETVEVLAQLVKEGKIGSIGLSEVSAATIRRAIKVHPIATVEAEFSLWATDILRNGVASTCAELGIPITAYCPLARGGLAKRLVPEDFPETDFRRTAPKYQRETLETNNRLTDEVIKLAERKGCTAAQVAVSWVRHMSGRNGLPIIIPIPGASTAERVMENAKEISLTEEELEEIEGIMSRNKIVGARYGGHGAQLVEL